MRKAFKRKSQRTSNPLDINFYEQRVQLLSYINNKHINSYRKEKMEKYVNKISKFCSVNVYPENF